MKCNRAKELFSAWRDGKLSESQRNELLEHVSSCASCAEQWAQYNEVLDPIAESPSAVPENFRSGWRGRIAAEPVPLVPRMVRPAWPNLAWAAAACFTLAVAWVGITSLRSPQLMKQDNIAESFPAEDVGRAPGALSEAATESAPQLKAAPPVPSSVSGTALPEERKIMRSATLTLESREVQKACDSISAAAGQLGGFVRRVSVESPGGNPHTGTVDISVPSSRFDETIRRLESIGDVRQKDVAGQDVTEEYVDLEARLRNWKNQESQLNVIMSKARDVSEILAVQGELGRVREEIERLTGRMQYIDRKTEFSDISVTVVQPGESQSVSPFWETLRGLGSQFSESILTLVTLIVAVLPWAGIGLLAFIFIRRWWIRRG